MCNTHMIESDKNMKRSIRASGDHATVLETEANTKTRCAREILDDEARLTFPKLASNAEKLRCLNPNGS